MRKKSAFAAALLSLVLAGTAVQAVGQEPESLATISSDAAVEGIDYVLVGSPDITKRSGPRETETRFYETGPISDDTMVIIRNDDGTLPFGLTEETVGEFVAEVQQQREVDLKAEASEIAEAPSVQARSGWKKYSAPLGGAWSGIYTSSQGIFKTTDAARTYYRFTAQAGTNQVGCGQGRGFYRGYNGSQMGTWSQFYALGCGANGDLGIGGGSVPWGYTGATGQFKARSGNVLHILTGEWFVN